MPPQSKVITADGPVVRTNEIDERTKPRRGSKHRPQTDTYLARYYARRAPEMEDAFLWPCRSADIDHLQGELPKMVEGLDVLEIACGTGFWTRFMAERARSITATDINEEMLIIARSKEYPEDRVRHVQQNAWKLSRLDGSFNAAVALFWWSHVPVSRARAFLAELNRALAPGSKVILIDNLPEDCRRTTPVGFDHDGNSYQRRFLRSGDAFDIIKNYPSKQTLFETLEDLGEDPSYTAFDCLWMLQYRTVGE